MIRKLTLTGIVLFAALAAGQGTQSSANDALFEAARAGNTAGIAAALDRGVNVDAKARYDLTALYIAANNGRLDAVKLLVARGANVNAEDSFYHTHAAEMAFSSGYAEVTMFLLQSGAKGDGLLMAGVQADNAALVKAALASDLSTEGLQSAVTLAGRLQRTALTATLKAAVDARPAPAAAPGFPVDAGTLPRYSGAYRDATSGFALNVTVQNGTLLAQAQGQPAFPLTPTAEAVFRIAEVNATLTFNGRGSAAESITLAQSGQTITLARVTSTALPAAASAPAAPVAPAATVADKPRPAGPRNWPSFRGEAGGGNGDGQRAVSEWDVATGKNIKWKTPIPGIANSSPIVWSNRIFVTTAISKGGDKTFRTGAYGDVKPVDDLSEHEWKIYCLDKATGKVLWEKTAFVGAPKTKRHPKASQANSTPATDGRRVVAAFGPIGLLVAWDFNGKELWRANLGILDSGWFFDPSVQWGHSSSPIIYNNSVILQSDMQKGSYIAAWDLGTGKQLWKTVRTDEIPTWGTPLITRAASGRDELVTNGTKIRGYDPATGKLLWTLGPNSEITVGSPVAGHGLIFVTGGYPPVRPVYAVRPGASGDISLPSGKDSSASIAWSNTTEGTYIPTPIVYGGYLYTFNINGIVTAYNAETGQRAFRGRVGMGGAFAASPVAADGRLYFASEDGEIFVLAAKPELNQIAKNDMKEIVMATPAISDGLIVVRTIGHIYGIGQ